MKRKVCIALSLLLLLGCLSACGGNNTGQEESGTDSSSNDNVVSDFQVGDVEVHEQILPWQYQEGEEVQNPYYKRTTDEEGNLVYAVLKASNNQVAYLPMSNTVVYTGDSDNCYFERTTNTYKLDGEDKTVVQFQLFVSNESPNSSTSAETEAISEEPEPELPDDEVSIVGDDGTTIIVSPDGSVETENTEASTEETTDEAVSDE